MNFKLTFILFLILAIFISMSDARQRKRIKRKPARKPVRHRPVTTTTTTTTTMAPEDYEICPADTMKQEARCFKDEDCDLTGLFHSFCVGESEEKQGYCCRPTHWFIIPEQNSTL